MYRQNIVLLAHHEPGVEIARFLAKRENIIRLYTTFGGPWKTDDYALCKTWLHADEIDSEGHLDGLANLDVDWVIAVYWPKLLPPEFLRIAKRGTINFHPALLPINRGWYPYVHSILDGSPAGVTLHEMLQEPDAGGVWVQRRVAVSPYDTAYTLDMRLQHEIVRLFKDHWHDIRMGRKRAVPQNEADANYHKRSEILGDYELRPDAMMEVRDLVKILRARSFGNQGFAFYRDGERKVYLNLRLSPTAEFREG